ncbi:YtxH domain-containing protein [Dyadobacter psychrotolerans]|uniref:YtxH domain-containing protein n=1 Tax=Dyadobacter psychrotolerans TaxID=2541721 RepID=A0A4R5DTF9_9BACT|nr:YtxH domain-containing protein [Dyadobacter psychrotolerans]TDE15580.1 YtxH domain-containing protein [Dyadobacter psychrotolerans]
MKSKYEDYEREESDGAGFVTGLFLGAVIGAVAALLYAPKSGEETRQEIKDLADQQKDNLKNQWDRTKEKAADVVNTAKEKLDSVAQKASNSVDVYADKAIDKVIQVADDAKSTVDKFRQTNDQFGNSEQI